MLSYSGGIMVFVYIVSKYVIVGLIKVLVNEWGVLNV